MFGAAIARYAKDISGRIKHIRYREIKRGGEMLSALKKYAEGAMRKNKYNARKTVVDNIVFDSAKEARRYSDLKLLENCGRIHSLTLQPRFDLIVNGMNCGYYKADFKYVENSKEIVEDVKSAMTAKLPVYRLKKKLVKAIYGIDIVEV